MKFKASSPVAGGVVYTALCMTSIFITIFSAAAYADIPWSDPVVVSNVAATLNTSGLATDGVGKWGLVFYNTTGTYFSRSVDNAATWSAPLLLGAGLKARIAISGSTWIVTVESGSAHAIDAYRSTDGGATWASPVPIAEDAVTVQGYGGLATDGAGNWVAAFHKYSDQSLAEMRVMTVRSTDGGATWGAPSETTRILQGSAVCDLRADASGVFILLFRGSLDNYSDRRFVFAVRSVDHGATWGPPVLVFDGIADGESVHPDGLATVAGDGNGGWLFVDSGFCDSDSAAASFSSFSSDGGNSWSEPKVRARGLENGGMPAAATDRQGNWVVASLSLNSIVVGRSSDRGQTWFPSQTFPRQVDQYEFRHAFAMDASGHWVHACASGGVVSVIRSLPDVDTDGDGLTDMWEVTHGMDPNDDGALDARQGPDGDLDGDGFSNYEEYLANTNPGDFSSTPLTGGPDVPVADGKGILVLVSLLAAAAAWGLLKMTRLA